MSAPRIKVGKVVVANFSSPHSFNFVGGEVLPACQPERAKALMLEQAEVEVPGIKGTVDIKLTFAMSPAVKAALVELENDIEVDIILVPFPVLEALRAAGNGLGKARVCRVADRVSKVVYGDRFCI